MPSYRGYRFPSEVISHAVWLYHRFSLSVRDVEDLLAERGINITYETIRVPPRRNRRAAIRFFRKLLKTHGAIPHCLITDKLPSYQSACRTLIPSVLHCTAPYANNRVEVSHQPTRHRERQMRGFKSIAHLQRFASVHGVLQNLFRVGRHLLRAAHHRALRTRAFAEWNVVTCAS